jgi:hypothetical protein
MGTWKLIWKLAHCYYSKIMFYITKRIQSIQSWQSRNLQNLEIFLFANSAWLQHEDLFDLNFYSRTFAQQWLQIKWLVDFQYLFFFFHAYVIIQIRPPQSYTYEKKSKSIIIQHFHSTFWKCLTDKSTWWICPFDQEFKLIWKPGSL